MKKTLLILIFILTSTLCGFAQIQNRILGCTLGVTSQKSTVSILKSRGLNVVKYEGNDLYGEGDVTFYQIKDGVSFGGYNWSDAKLRFINGKFASILFQTYGASDAQYNKLKSTIISKYKHYQKDFGNHPYFQDGKTEIILMNNSNGWMSISYGDQKLFDVESNSSNSSDF
mgnify:CR=1 FL=1